MTESEGGGNSRVPSRVTLSGLAVAAISKLVMSLMNAQGMWYYYRMHGQRQETERAV